MKIQILRRTCFAGRPLLAGEVHDIPDRDARYLVACGKAEKAQDSPPDLVAQRPRTRKPRIIEAA